MHRTLGTRLACLAFPRGVGGRHMELLAYSCYGASPGHHVGMSRGLEATSGGPAQPTSAQFPSTGVKSTLRPHDAPTHSSGGGLWEVLH